MAVGAQKGMVVAARKGMAAASSDQDVKSPPSPSRSGRRRPVVEPLPWSPRPAVDPMAWSPLLIRRAWREERGGATGDERGWGDGECIGRGCGVGERSFRVVPPNWRNECVPDIGGIFSFGERVGSSPFLI